MTDFVIPITLRCCAHKFYRAMPWEIIYRCERVKGDPIERELQRRAILREAYPLDGDRVDFEVTKLPYVRNGARYTLIKFPDLAAATEWRLMYLEEFADVDFEMVC